MKKHIIWLVIGLILLALCVFGLKGCDGKVSMPLIGGTRQDAADKAAAEADALIDKISDPVTLEDEAAIAAARTAYDALSDEAKAKVTKLPKLEAAETALAKLKNQNQDASSQAKAADDLIGKISDPVTLEDETAIAEARAAYEALSDEGKAKVTKLSVLEAAEAALAKLKGNGNADFKKGDTVTFTGGNVYVSPTATEASRFIGSETVCEVTIVTENGEHRYHLISQDGGGVYGWCDAENIKAK